MVALGGVLLPAVGAVILYVARPVSRSALVVLSIAGWERLGAAVLEFRGFGLGHLCGRAESVTSEGWERSSERTEPRSRGVGPPEVGVAFASSRGP